MRDMGNHVPCSLKLTPDDTVCTGMNTESIIALDCMGGDFGIPVVVPAALKALATYPELSVIMVGDEAAIEAWKRKEWPRIKKTPGGWAPISSSSTKPASS